MGKVATVTSGGTPSRDNKNNWGGNIPWVTTSEIKYKNIYDSKEKITAEGLKNSSAKLFNPGTILMAMYGQGNTRGDVAKLEIEAATNQACAAIIPHKDFDVDFVFQYLIRQYEEIRRMSNEGGQKNLSGSIVKDINLHFPELSEQQKIASFLSKVDQKISLLTKKHELLVQYKKGVMQKIFSQEIRFKDKDGKDFPEWKELPLSEYAQIVGGGTPETSNSAYWGGDIQWFTPTELKKKYASESVRRITDSGLKNSSAKMLPAGTVLFSSRATVGDVSIALNECCTNQGFQSFIPNSGNSSEFLYYWISNNKKLFLEKASGSTFLEISKKEIEKILIQIPSKEEQEKIAILLSDFDKKIQLIQSQLESTKQYKQGLLQQMFI